ncbi:acetylglutamate kinase [Metabacillus fastidiosus]|uniref:Acetylglutamate kinase n=1 Tax=Metabacillus fastidiosus TaxID=1458 RepID=A0ABU6P4T5_9BACI|nr:acetylglutamate kinase [Metabacillus fastidiosus]MED4403166.1 acetylglutamate kinase [Metabacillus fastidiosus]MED4455400.1 acetylglutamate kinase [Metabacillus fastidiosus]MED4461591.1 acetylglutamate kinase [Metabacillus fastidiosus]
MGKTVVLKCGGSIIHELSKQFFDSLKQLIENKWQVVIVHGGGPDITKMLTELQIQTEFHNGQRKTTPEVLDVVEMVLSGKINKHLTNLLQQNGLNALGISGTDSIITADYLNKEALGLVGSVTNVETNLIHLLLENGYLPVVTPLAKTDNHETLNVNADLAAAAIANAIGAEKLLFVTDVPGILDNDKNVITSTTPEKINELIENGTITGGMIPKVESAISTLSDKCQEVMIVSGTQAFVEKEQFLGTKIYNEKEVMTL